MTSKVSLLVIILISWLQSRFITTTLSFPFNHSLATTTNNYLFKLASIRQQPVYDPNEKYLAFFTHSGFQNQLIQGNQKSSSFYSVTYMNNSGKWYFISLLLESNTDITKGFTG